MKLNDFLNKVDDNFQIGITIVDNKDNYYCINQDDYDTLNNYLAIQTLSKESVEDQKQYILNQNFEIEQIKSMYFKKDFIKIHVK
jgi:hypothetical protein